MIQRAVQRILDGYHLSAKEFEDSIREIAEGRATQAQMAGFLVALRQRGETAEEIAAMASTMRDYCIRIRPRVEGRLVDTCGTGGDRSKTFNVSTLAAIVAAGAGLKVAKHGNRSVTSNCGSADVLERLGFNLAVTPDGVRRSIEEVGIGFMFAPSFHPTMKSVAPVRKELGVRTVFNLMGPLVNPAGANAQLVGVYSPELVPKIAEALRILDVEEALVVHGVEGMDEISISGKTLVSRVRNGTVETIELSPPDFGVKTQSSVPLVVHSPDEGARVALEILRGTHGLFSAGEMVVANAAAALVVGKKTDSFEDASELARRSIRTGEALGKLEMLVASSGGDTSRIDVPEAN